MVKEFLKDKSFTSCSQAHQQFQTTIKETITYPQFNSIFRNCITEEICELADESVSENHEKEKIKLYTIEEIEKKFDKSILIPIKSNTILDDLVSTSCGTMPATISMVPGESGVGKTTILLYYLSKIREVNPKKELLFVSSEMNQIHMYKYAQRVKIPGIKILFLGDYDYPHEVLEEELKKGYDLVLLDSFQDTINKCMESIILSARMTEKWLLKLLDRTRLGNNEKKKYTAFLCTQHMTKGGTYTGSTGIKHMTDSMMMLRFDETDGITTYIEFCKNRDGSVRKRLYYSISDKGVVLDIERYKTDEAIKVAATTELIRRKENEKAFDTIFLGKQNDTSLMNIPTELLEQEEEEA